MRSSHAAVTPDRLRQLAERDDTVVYEPTYTHTFEPWPSARVKACVAHIVDVARGCATQVEAAAMARAASPEVAEFERHYQVMFKRLTEPEVARNDGMVKIVQQMIALRERVVRGAMTDVEAQSMLSEQALTELAAQAQARPDHEDSSAASR